jgi:nicotinamidase-related amidase
VPDCGVPEAETRSALLVIDMQEAVVAGCLDVPGVISRINDLSGRARQVGAPVVFIQNEDPTDPDMTAGADGWQLAKAMDHLDGDPIVGKSYRDSFAETVLGAVLDKTGAQHLVITGAHADFCVLTTALSAVQRGYDITLVGDAHTARTHTLPTGELSAEAIVVFVNSRIGTLTHPGRTVRVVPAADVSF